MGTLATAIAESHAARRARTREETDRKIMQAALRIAMSRGIAAVTIEEVSRDSGVAKTTIYRRYRNADDLLRQLSAWKLDDADVSEFEISRDGLEAMLRHVIARFDEGIGVKAIGMVLSSDSEFFGHIVEQVVMPAKARLAEYLRRGQALGALRGDLDVDFLFSTMLGSMVANETLGGRMGGEDSPAETTEPGESTDSVSPSALDWPARMANLIWPTIVATSR